MSYSTKGALDEKEFVSRLALNTVKVLLPTLFKQLKGDFTKVIENCENVETLNQAKIAACYAADAACYAAADAAADAADADADAAAAADKILFLSAKIAEDILIEMNVPGVRFLYLLEE